MSAEERTGWRDEALSARHRSWGTQCPAVDIDFLLLEYDKGQPVALVEYKHERAVTQDTTHPSYRAVSRLGNAAGLPFFGVRYSDDFAAWKVTPLNKISLTHLTSTVEMTEQQYVDWLHKLRQETRTQL